MGGVTGAGHKGAPKWLGLERGVAYNGGVIGGGAKRDGEVEMGVAKLGIRGGGGATEVGGGAGGDT